MLTDFKVVNLSPDPNDNSIIATAIDVKVDLIVSGDRKHMLALGEVRGIPLSQRVKPWS